MVRSIGLVAAIALWVSLLAAAIYAFNFGQIEPIEQSKLINQGFLCSQANCRKKKAINLPFHVPMKLASKTEKAHLFFEVDFKVIPDQILGIYLPKIADNVSINFNQVQIRQAEIGVRSWNQPILSQVPNAILRTGRNQIKIELIAPPQEGLEIFPFYIGSHIELSKALTTRTDWSTGIAKFSLGLMIILFLFVGSVWLVLPNEKAYLWLSMSCLSSCVFLVHYGYNISFIPYKYWTLAWSYSMFFYVFFVLKFISYFLRQPHVRLQNMFLIFVVICLFITIPSPVRLRML